jgi:hypothetical protein
LQAALKEGASDINFMGRIVQLDPNAGIFVTLNPAGKGYGGRSKLPDNLKQLFRQVFCMHHAMAHHVQQLPKFLHPARELIPTS